ncbi:MAG: hypothetical protein MOIL_01062 [Candidatus Methanolliviera sp. GoM_oil]|nr:MAG: hypothetical protein MOIL_01062 [Candidatus Methanolliviera sp. GoM_oil]
MMRSIPILSLLVLFICAAVIPTVGALSVGEIHFDKMPLSPGDKVNLSIPIINNGDGKRDVVVQLQQATFSCLMGNNTFIISGEIGEHPSSKSIGILDGSDGLGDLRSGEKRIAHFVVYVAPDAVGGIYNLNIKASYRNAFSSKTEMLGTISIPVESSYIIISNVSDDVIAPGSANEMTIEIKNVGRNRIKNVVLEVGTISPTSSATPSTSMMPSSIMEMMGGTIPSFGEEEEKVPAISLVGSGNRLYIGDLSPGESRPVEVKLVADPKTKKGLYRLPVTIDHWGGSSSDSIAVRVISRAEISMPEIETSPREVKPNTTATLLVTIENNGGDDARSVRVDILENRYLTGKGSWNSSYAGTVAPGDAGSAIFQMTVLEGAPEKLPIAMKISYTDDLGEHAIVAKKQISVSQVKEAKSPAERVPILAILIVLVLAVAVLGFYLYRKRAKK